MLQMTVLLNEGGTRPAARRLVFSTAWGAIGRMLARLAAQRRQRHEIRRTTRVLSRLSDHMLRDIGIHRSEISSIARSGRDAMRDRL
jgi:uncharacterized protein YjiS (DUF1127 family)